MKRFGLLFAALFITALAMAAGPEKVPTWLVGKYSGYSSYMKASFDLTITANGIIFADTKFEKDKMYHVSGEYKHKALILGKKIYGINKRANGIGIVNEGNRKDVVELKRSA